MKEHRLKELEEYINENEVCTIKELCKVFGVSIATMRRDIDIMFEKGIVRKVYGGIRLNRGEAIGVLPFQQREIKNINEKEYIGKLAAGLIDENDTVFIDSGTTMIFLVKYLPQKKVNIITNNLNVVMECSTHENIDIISCGGVFSRITNSFGGEIAHRALSSMNMTKAFIATTGASFEAGFTNALLLETPIKKTAVNRSGEVYVMLDSSKWNVVSLMTFCELKQVTGVITDKKPPKEFEKYFLKNGIKMIY